MGTAEQVLFPSRRAGLWCFYYLRFSPTGGDTWGWVSIPASGIMVFLPRGHDYVNATKVNIGKFPSRRAGLWCFYEVSMWNRLKWSLTLVVVSIPASGIMVFLQTPRRVYFEGVSVFPSRRAGLWCFYKRRQIMSRLAAQARFHPGERDYGVSTSRGRPSVRGWPMRFPSRRAGLWCFYEAGRCTAQPARSFPSRRAGLWCFYQGSANWKK